MFKYQLIKYLNSLTKRKTSMILKKSKILIIAGFMNISKWLRTSFGEEILKWKNYTMILSGFEWVPNVSIRLILHCYDPDNFKSCN